MPKSSSRWFVCSTLALLVGCAGSDATESSPVEQDHPQTPAAPADGTNDPGATTKPGDTVTIKFENTDGYKAELRGAVGPLK